LFFSFFYRIGIVGYGDIGRAAAKLAKAYGMKVIALRRTIPSPEAIQQDPYCDVVYDTRSLNKLFNESDYVLCSAPLTPDTYQMISKEQFDNAKENLVFINVGRGPVVDEDALIDALKDGRLKGAGLDVFVNEPLDESSELWKLENVLLSP
jgi:phosphoglycerate dehydrogenase-like enzyme